MGALRRWLAKAQGRDGLPAAEMLLQDLRFTMRSLRRDLGFAVFAVLIVGLGIGATSTVFSVSNALLLRPLPFRDPSQLVWISSGSSEGMSARTVQVGNFLDLRSANQSFEDIAGFFAFYGVGDAKVTGRGEPERLTSVPVSGNFFPLLGVQPVIGRLFNAEECKFRGPAAVLLSYRVWQNRFSADPSIVGQQLTVNEEPVTVIGVLPESFDFSSVFAPGARIDLYTAFPLSEETNRMGNTLALIGRLKPGVPLAQAQSEAAVLAARMKREHPNRNTFEPRMQFLNDQVSGRFRYALLVLACAVGLVLLIVCANLSNLLLARSSARQREIAIRAAIGAGRGRLVRQLLTESVALSLCGAVVGLFFAVLATRAVHTLDGISIPLLNQVRLDWQAAGFTALVALATGVVFGLAPALQVSFVRMQDALKDGSRGMTEAREQGWFRSSLVVAEIALACVLLVGSGLLLRSFLNVLDVDLGFRPENAVALRIDPGQGYDDFNKQNHYISEALRLVKAVPVIQGAALVDNLPLGRNRSWGVSAVGAVYGRGQWPSAYVRVVSEGYFGTMGIRLIAGRDFTRRDDPAAEKVIVIDETLARRLWPGQDAIGKMMRADGERRVVGIVRDVRHLTLEGSGGGEMYLPMRQSRDWATMDLVVRGERPPSELAAAVRHALRPLDPNLPAGDFRTLRQMVERSASPRRFLVLLLAGFAGFALILASLGIYAVISCAVNKRRSEIGIRIALGASARDVQSSILAHTLRLAIAGIVLGAGASWAMTRLIASMLFGVEPADPATFAATLGTLILAALLAGWIPAWRASRLDPAVALRAD